MSSVFDILIYLDEILVKNLSSLVLTGYIETVTLTQAFDKSLSAGIHDGDKMENSNQGSITQMKREGYKDKNKLQACNNLNGSHNDKTLDARHCIREEKKIQRTYTTFVLNNKLRDYFLENKMLQHRSSNDVENNGITEGDLIELEGILTNNSLLTYIDTFINIINIFGCDYLDEVIKKGQCKTNINCTIALKLLQYLKTILLANNTQDLIMDCGKGNAIITVNTKNFMNSENNIFDKINCRCRVVGKVVKTCTRDQDTISLFRKTGQEEFYEKFFNKISPLVYCLEKNDILLPRCPKLRFDKRTIQIMPLNIYM